MFEWICMVEVKLRDTEDTKWSHYVVKAGTPEGVVKAVEHEVRSDYATEPFTVIYLDMLRGD